MELFAQGFIFGLATAAPVGPIGILTIRRTLVGGLLFGLLSGLGAATADAVYGTIAALGLTAVSAFLIQHKPTLQLIGGLFLLYLGMQSLRAKPVTSKQYSVNRNAYTDTSIDNSQLTINHLQLKKAYASTLFLTLSNPVTILSFTAVFAGFGLGSQTKSAGSSIILVIGVFLGSALWWLFLTGMVTAVRGKLVHQGKLNERALRIINLISGLILVGFSVLLLGNLLL